MNLVDIKKRNRNNVYQLVYKSKNISKPDLAANLGISLPTVTQCVNELKELKLVTDDGFFESTGGRKAAVISCHSDVRISIGVEILKESVQVVAVDLYGAIIHQKFYDLPFKSDEFYCVCLGNCINSFFIELNVSRETLLGVGIAIQGLVNPENGHVTFGPLLDADGFSVDRIGKYVSFPCMMQHDTELAAGYALWHKPSVRDALYLVLNRNLGGSVIINRHAHRSRHLPSGLVAHMTLVTGGRRCYCGACGCAETYCSAEALIADFCESYDEFFQKLRGGEPEHMVRWQEYLGHLAEMIYNYQIILNTEVLLGGLVADYILDEDIEVLSELVLKRTRITSTMPNILLSKHNNAAAGAALYYIEEFLSQFGEKWIP